MDKLFASARRVQPADTEKLAALQRYQRAVKPAMANLPRLLGTLA